MPQPIAPLHSYLIDVPCTTPGTKPDPDASFVSANAEQFYQYQPTKLFLSEGRLVDGIDVFGWLNYYTSWAVV